MKEKRLHGETAWLLCTPLLSIVFLINFGFKMKLVKFAKQNFFLICLFLFSLVILLVNIRINNFRYDNFDYGKFDLGNMTQMVWNTLHGRFLYLNPVAPFIYLFHALLYDNKVSIGPYFLWAAGLALAVFFIGYNTFVKLEDRFVKRM